MSKDGSQERHHASKTIDVVRNRKGKNGAGKRIFERVRLEGDSQKRESWHESLIRRRKAADIFLSAFLKKTGEFFESPDTPPDKVEQLLKITEEACSMLGGLSEIKDGERLSNGQLKIWEGKLRDFELKAEELKKLSLEIQEILTDALRKKVETHGVRPSLEIDDIERLFGAILGRGPREELRAVEVGLSKVYEKLDVKEAKELERDAKNILESMRKVGDLLEDVNSSTKDDGEKIEKMRDFFRAKKQELVDLAKEALERHQDRLGYKLDEKGQKVYRIQKVQEASKNAGDAVTELTEKVANAVVADKTDQKVPDARGKDAAAGRQILDDLDTDVLNVRGEEADKLIESMGLKEKVASLGAEGVEVRLVVAWGLDLEKTKEEILEEAKEKIAEILSRKVEQNSPSSRKTIEILGEIKAGGKSDEKEERLGENFSLLDQIPALGESGLRLKNAVESAINGGLTPANEKKMRERLQKLYNTLVALRTKKREYGQLVMDASNMLGASGPAVAYEKAGGAIVDAFLPLDKNGSVNIEELIADSLRKAGEAIKSDYAVLPASDAADLEAEKKRKKDEERDIAERESRGLPLSAENFETMFYAVMLVKTFVFSHPQANGEEVRGFLIKSLQDRKIELSEAQADCLDRFLVSELDYKYVEQDADPGALGRTLASKDVSSQTSDVGRLAPDETAVKEIKSKAKKMGAEVSDKVKRREWAIDDILNFLTDGGKKVPDGKDKMENAVRKSKERLEKELGITDKGEVKKIWEQVAESLKNSDMLRADKLHKIWVTEFFK